MRIGIDIDGVLVNDDDYILDYATKHSYENNIDALEIPYHYETRKFNWSVEVREDYFNKYFTNYVKNEPARRFASEVIKKLKDDGHEIYIITSRRHSTRQTNEGEEMRTNIINWLKKNDIVYDEVYFSSDKTKEIKELNIDVMIEDSPVTIPLFAELTHVFCYDCRYNTNIKHNNVTRVFSWYDIYQKIKKLNDKQK